MRLTGAAERPNPVNTTSRGVAKVRIPQAGPIRSDIDIDNQGGQNILFCHIHWINQANGTGPIIWLLTPAGANADGSPMFPAGVQLRVSGSFFDVGQEAIYSTHSSNPFANEATARAALFADPSQFYVNCHSVAFGGGFIRGDLPATRHH